MRKEKPDLNVTDTVLQLIKDFHMNYSQRQRFAANVRYLLGDHKGLMIVPGDVKVLKNVDLSSDEPYPSKYHYTKLIEVFSGHRGDNTRAISSV